MIDNWKQQALELAKDGKSWRKIAKELGVAKSTCSDYLRKAFIPQPTNSEECATKGIHHEAKILVLDIESSPIISHVWSLWNNNVGLNQIEKDWHLLSFAAKWLGSDESEVMYQDQSNVDWIENDLDLCLSLRNLLNQADCVIAQNGRKFDLKKINARMILNGLPPIKPVRIIDTLEIAKQEFGFTSNKLEYMTDKLCKKYKKLKHTDFPGHTLWVECMKKNPLAWEEMKRYNIHDILSLEELYMIIRSWSSKHPSMGIFTENNVITCRICGSTNMEQEGHWFTNLSKFPLHLCECGAWNRGRKTSTTGNERLTFGSAAL